MKKLLLFLFLPTLLPSAQAKSLNVLFVGNSYTHVNGIPEILKTMAAAKGHTLTYQQQTPSGRTFQQHWEEKKAVEMMRTGNFDVVVLQDQSFEPVSDPENMLKYGKMLAAEADKTGARKVYYLTMAYKEPVDWMEEDRTGAALFPEMLDRLTKAYSRLARETGGEIAPVGIAWKLAYDTMPDLQLHAPDHSHPAPEGAYLTAMVLFATLYGEAPKDMPNKLTVEVRKKGGMKSVEIALDAETQKVLEAAAQKACQNFRLKRE